MLKDELSFLQTHYLRRSTLAADGLLNQPAIDKMRMEHEAGTADHGHRLWLLLNSEVWHRHFIRDESVDDLTAEISEAKARSMAGDNASTRLADAA